MMENEWNFRHGVAYIFKPLHAYQFYLSGKNVYLPVILRSADVIPKYMNTSLPNI